MLTQLTIENFGLIDRISLEFHNHLNILTGETGAGKSIVIDALRAALGDRIQTAQLRDTKKQCLIEAIFDLSNSDLKNLSLFSDFLSEEDSSLIIQRTHSLEGRNKIKINGLNITITQLKEIGNHLIDFHGPHDHQMLLNAESHRGMLDRLVNFGNLFEEYNTIFKNYVCLKKQLEELQGLATSRERELDLLSHQVKELEQISFNEKEYDDLLQEQTKINNAQNLNEHVSQILPLLDESPTNITELIRQTFAPMRKLNHIDEQTSPHMSTLTQLQEISDQLIAELRDYADGLSFEPQHAHEINTRCDIYDDIKRKYGPSLANAEQFYIQAKEKHELLANFEQKDTTLRQQIADLKKTLKTTAQKITRQREKTALSLKKTIEKELAELGIAKVKFEVRITEGELRQHGQDIVTFYISPNIGEELKPLAQIVSSGEAARVMLALKKSLIKVDPIGVLIFDEIDAQIGGRLGTITGKKLRDLSLYRQVILITHLPQIAAFADIHFKITKGIADKRAITKASALNSESRIKELAKMMSGENESHISLKHATDMLSKANQ